MSHDSGSGAPPCKILIVKGIPMPKRVLKRGPPKQALNPALGKPFIAIVASGTKSPIEFPQASKVRPRTMSLRPNITPNAFKRLTNSLAMIKIHTIAIANPTIQNTKWYFGALEVDVNPTIPANNTPKISVTCQTWTGEPPISSKAILMAKTIKSGPKTH